MIARDWQRLLFNLLLGPPIAYVVALALIILFLLAVSSTPEGNWPIISFLLVIAGPALPIGYMFGALPAFINSVATSVLARFVRRRRLRLLAAIPVGALSTWLGAGWVLGLGGDYKFDSDYMKLLLTVAVPIGGAVASLACTALVERFGSRKGLAEEIA